MEQYLRRLFDRMYPILVRFIYRRVWDVDLAEDIAQEAFVRLLNERPRKPEAWLFTVADHLASNAIRGEHRRTRTLHLMAGVGADTVASAADRLALDNETARQVRQALDALSERDRTLIVLHLDGMTYKELAAIVGVKPSSIAPLLARARERFLRCVFTHASQIENAHDRKTSAS